MKNSMSSSSPIDKMLQIINVQAKKNIVKRKISSSNDIKADIKEPFAHQIEFERDFTLRRNEDPVKQHKFFNQTPVERMETNDLRLPSINGKKNNNTQKENATSRNEPINLYKIEGRKANLEMYTDPKTKTFTNQSFDDRGGGGLMLQIKPIKYQKSPNKNLQHRLRSNKNVKSLNPVKIQSNKALHQGTEQATLSSDKIIENKQSKIKIPKTMSLLKKDSIDVRKNQNKGSLQKYERKQTKSNSTIQLLQKKKYSVNYLDFCLFLSLLNKINSAPQYNGVYKAFVGKGNNSILIKNSLKNRFWWNISDNDTDANLLWLQNRDNKLIQSLKSFNPNKINESIQNPISSKKYKFLLEKGKESDKSEQYKQHTQSGLWKLLSSQQREKYSKSSFDAEVVTDQTFYQAQNPNKAKLHNHFQFNWHITNKKALYYNLKKFYEATKQNPFQYIPLTFHVQFEGDQEWNRFQKHYNQKEQILNAKGSGKSKKKREKNLWIIKPGQNSNQGCGIEVAETIEEIKQIMKNKQSGRKRSHIIQKYLMPLLYNKRKFDIRTYIVVTSVNGIVKAYWYEEGYLRTASKQFSLKNLKNRFIHLTNDAVQKKCEDYGKYQNANKISFIDFQKYLDNNFPQKKYNFFSTVYPMMMKQTADAIRCVHSVLDSNNRQQTFEIFGLDFMIDEDFGTWLIQINNNPCLQLCCPLLARLIPNMIQNAFKIAIDPIFPPPKDYPKSKQMQTELFENNKFSLIFNSAQQKENLKDYINELNPKNLSNIVESDQDQEQHDD